MNPSFCEIENEIKTASIEATFNKSLRQINYEKISSFRKILDRKL